jgi:hypothetical protein
MSPVSEDSQIGEVAGPEVVTSFPGQLPSERVLWSGRPAPLPYAYRRLSPAFPFGLGILVFAALWELDAIGNGHNRVWVVAGLVFLLAGFYAVLLRPLLLILVARRRVYAVTDRRVIRLRRGHEGAEVVESACAWRPPVAADARRPGGRAVVDVALSGASARVGRWGWWRLGEDGDVLACLTDAPAALAALALLRAGSAAPAGAWAGGARTP